MAVKYLPPSLFRLPTLISFTTASSIHANLVSVLPRRPRLKHLNHHPLTPPLHKLIHQQSHIRQHKPHDIEPEKLCRMSCAQFQADLCLICVPQAGVFDLACYLICASVSNTSVYQAGQKNGILGRERDSHTQDLCSVE